MEVPPGNDARIFPGIAHENDILEFEIADLEKRGNFSLYKVLKIEEVNECNQFLDPPIEMEKIFQSGGLVYIPLHEYGMMDQFSMGIKAPVNLLTGNGTTNGTNNGDTVDPSENENDNDNQGGNEIDDKVIPCEDTPAGCGGTE